MPSKPYYDVEETYWRYYDTPDGEQPLRKAAVCAKYGAVAGLIFSTLDVLMYSHPAGAGGVVRRYLYLTLPLAGMGATFALVANGVQRLRREDDMLNYLAGGVAAAPIFGVYTRTKLSVFAAAVGLGVAGMIKKSAVDNDWPFFPPFSQQATNARLRRDWTLTPDYRGIGYTSNLPGEECVPMPPPKPLPPGFDPCVKEGVQCTKSEPPQYPCPSPEAKK